MKNKDEFKGPPKDFKKSIILICSIFVMGLIMVFLSGGFSKEYLGKSILVLVIFLSVLLIGLFGRYKYGRKIDRGETNLPWILLIVSGGVMALSNTILLFVDKVSPKYYSQIGLGLTFVIYSIKMMKKHK
jgi:membrane protease YdiL (CAAX protease family)